MARFAVFASGRGSNFIEIHRFFKNTAHTLVALITDKPGCPAADYAREHSIPLIAVQYGKRNREEAEREILEKLEQFMPIDLFVLAGFMRLLTPLFVNRFPNKIINIHPSLLPKYPGAHAISESYASRDTMLGVTIHYVDTGMDTGEIIVQEQFERGPGQSIEEVESIIHSIEHRLYPQVILSIVSELEKQEALH